MSNCKCTIVFTLPYVSELFEKKNPDFVRKYKINTVFNNENTRRHALLKPNLKQSFWRQKSY